jgi:hypothetical protein
MTAPLPRPPSDDELAALLARRYRDTSPEFEARWVALKRELRQMPPPRRLPVWPLAGWLGAAAAVASIGLFLSRPTVPPAPELAPQVRELLALDAALARAQPLLDEETRVALLHLSPASSSHD